MTIIRHITDRQSAVHLSSLGRETFTQTFGHLYKSEDLNSFLEESHSIEKYQALICDPAHALWLAENALGTPVGYAVCGPCTLPVPDMPDSAGELGRLYFKKEAQGNGQGSALLGICLDWLDDHFEHVYLSVYSENFGAQRLYHRYGFEKIHDYHYMVGNHADPEWIMKRRSDISKGLPDSSKGL